jgi:hypothetical protein
MMQQFGDEPSSVSSSAPSWAFERMLTEVAKNRAGSAKGALMTLAP